MLYENNQLKEEKDDLLDKNNQLRNDVDKINEKLSRRKEKYEALKGKNKALKEKNKVLHGDNKNLYKKNRNLDEQNNYMRNLLSYFGILFNEDGEQISNNTENQQMLNSFISSWTRSNGSGLSNGLNGSADNQEQKPIPQTSFSQLQK